MHRLTALLEPITDERPSVFADRIGRAYSHSKPLSHKKRFGQYLTPVAIADFLASLVDCNTDEVRILDPGAGSGVLACAVAEALASQEQHPRRLIIDAYEIDRELLPLLDRSLRYLRSQLRRRDIAVEYRAIQDDFVLTHAMKLQQSEMLFRADGDQDKYDVVIGNPPYFKLPKSDPRAKAADNVVHGQPNIYALFMAVSAAMLTSGGEIVFITPRSFTSGPYFQRFRERFFARIQLEAVHVFASRRDAFNRDAVLQENIVVKGRYREHWAKVDPDGLVTVSISHGATDIEFREVRTAQLNELLDMTSREKMLRIPSSQHEYQIINRIDKWTGSLGSYGMQVSTGPVVPFRAVELLSTNGKEPARCAPLLWLQHVHPMRVEWPAVVCKKPQYISTRSKDSTPLLLQNRNYVLLRRFSAKEEPRRLIAAPLLANQLGYDWIGIENHLNYLHRPGDSLTEEEAVGLAVIYNSEFMDTYFRVLNGSTQVSATEIRKIPLPSLDVIVEIGRLAKRRELDNAAIEELAQFAFVDRTRQRTKTHA